MTPFNSTPLICVAFGSAAESESFAERISDFSESSALVDNEVSSAEFIHAITKHQSAWLIIDDEMKSNSTMKALAKRATATHEYFRCMVVGEIDEKAWPTNTIFLSSDALSTAVIDRLRNESHVLRISISRNRHMRRLQRR
ncbi:MAG: hypothetical protein CMD33_03340 [Flavobacteriales bacterium]|nr:hypothetical protein [Flavobacteriales bacterium]